MALSAARLRLARLLGTWQQHPEVLRLCPAGGVRRMEARVARLDVLVTSPDPEAWLSRVVGDADWARVVRGPEHLEGELADGTPVYARCLREEPSVAACAWLALTGPDEHVRELAARARGRGLSLTPIALKGPQGPCDLRDEAELYQALGLPFVPPEWRAHALADPPPADLLTMGDVRGAFFAATIADQGSLAPPALLHAAGEEGYEWLVLADRWRAEPPELAQARVGEIHALLGPAAVGARPFVGARVRASEAHLVDRSPRLADAFDLLILELDPQEATRSGPDMGALTTLLAHPRLRVLAHADEACAWGGRPQVHQALLEAAAAHGVAVEVSGAPQAQPRALAWHRDAQAAGLCALAGARILSPAQFEEALCAVGQLRGGGWQRQRVLSTLSAAELARLWQVGAP